MRNWSLVRFTCSDHTGMGRSELVCRYFVKKCWLPRPFFNTYEDRKSKRDRWGREAQIYRGKHQVREDIATEFDFVAVDVPPARAALFFSMRSRSIPSACTFCAAA